MKPPFKFWFVAFMIQWMLPPIWTPVTILGFVFGIVHNAFVTGRRIANEVLSWCDEVNP